MSSTVFFQNVTPKLFSLNTGVFNIFVQENDKIMNISIFENRKINKCFYGL